MSHFPPISEDSFTSGRFYGQSVIVTGAAGGIGRAVAIRCAREGGLVIAADNDRTTPGNPGVREAMRAAKAVGGRIAVPSFPEAAHG